MDQYLYPQLKKKVINDRWWRYVVIYEPLTLTKITPDEDTRLKCRKVVMNGDFKRYIESCLK